MKHFQNRWTILQFYSFKHFSQYNPSGPHVSQPILPLFPFLHPLTVLITLNFSLSGAPSGSIPPFSPRPSCRSFLLLSLWCAFVILFLGGHFLSFLPRTWPHPNETWPLQMLWSDMFTWLCLQPVLKLSNSFVSSSHLVCVTWKVLLKWCSYI